MEKSTDLAKSLYEQRKYQETIDTCNAILASDCNSIDALRLIAKSFLAIAKIDMARLYLNKVLNLKPNDYEVIKEIGNTYQSAGDINKAKEYYHKA